MEERVYWLALVSALLLGKHYVGVDISREYVEYAKRRLQSAQKEKARVMRELGLHIAKERRNRTELRK